MYVGPSCVAAQVDPWQASSHSRCSEVGAVYQLLDREGGGRTSATRRPPETSLDGCCSGVGVTAVTAGVASAQWEERRGHVELEIFMSVCLSFYLSVSLSVFLTSCRHAF